MTGRRLARGLGLAAIAVAWACEPTRPPEPEPRPTRPVFEMKTRERTVGGCIAGTEGCTYIRLDYPGLVAVPEGTGLLAESAADVIRGFVFRPLGDLPEEGALDVLEQFREATEGASASDEPWYVERKAFVLRNDDTVLALSLSERTSMGTGRGQSVRFVNLDASTGEPVALDDVVAEAKRPEVRALVEASLRRRLGLEPEADLRAAGLVLANGELALTENVAVADEGLIFFYDAGEIAPEATEVVLGWDELTDLVDARFSPSAGDAGP